MGLHGSQRDCRFRTRAGPGYPVSSCEDGAAGCGGGRRDGVSQQLRGRVRRGTWRGEGASPHRSDRGRVVLAPSQHVTARPGPHATVAGEHTPRPAIASPYAARLFGRPADWPGVAEEPSARGRWPAGSPVTSGATCPLGRDHVRCGTDCARYLRRSCGGRERRCRCRTSAERGHRSRRGGLAAGRTGGGAPGLLQRRVAGPFRPARRSALRTLFTARAAAAASSSSSRGPCSRGRRRG